MLWKICLPAHGAVHPKPEARQTGGQLSDDAFPRIWLSLQEKGTFSDGQVGADVPDHLQKQLPLLGVTIERRTAERLKSRAVDVFRVFQVAGSDLVGKAEPGIMLQQLAGLQIEDAVFQIHQFLTPVELVAFAQEILPPGQALSDLPQIIR